MKKESPNNKRLRMENEEKKKQIDEEFGAAHRSNPEESNLPPEIEGQFLDNIMAFEHAWKDAKQITLYEFLGNPAFRKTEELTENEIGDELNRLYELMNQHQVSLDTICDVSKQEIYRFITEELFQQEIDDMHIPGMMSCFTYEEFHPNHAYDIERYSNDFIKSYLSKTDDFYMHELSSNASTQNWHRYFREAFSSFTLNKFEIIDLNFDINSAEAQVDFECDFTALVDNSKDTLRFNGKGKLLFIYQWDFWYVDSVEFPSNYKI
ncbi:MAG: hypothetical protein WCK78_17655 [Paludibacter sp.]